VARKKHTCVLPCLLADEATVAFCKFGFRRVRIVAADVSNSGEEYAVNCPQGAPAGDEYSLTMTGVFTKGKGAALEEPNMYQVGEYECTHGSENSAPECHTVSEWAQMDMIAGLPERVVFTMADGSQVGVQGESMHRIPGFISCGAGEFIVFCHLYFEFLERQQVDMVTKTKYGQTEFMSTQEHTAALEAKQRELFGAGNTMTLTFRYRLKGVPEGGFQQIEIDKESCVTGEYGINHCHSIPEALNSRGNSYAVGDHVEVAGPTTK
jgi:hypothetical protein